MNYLEMEERHKYLIELSWPPLSSLGMRGDPYMSHSTSLIKVYGKDHVFVHNDLLYEYFLFSETYSMRAYHTVEIQKR